MNKEMMLLHICYNTIIFILGLSFGYLITKIKQQNSNFKNENTHLAYEHTLKNKIQNLEDKLKLHQQSEQEIHFNKNKLSELQNKLDISETALINVKQSYHDLQQKLKTQQDINQTQNFINLEKLLIPIREQIDNCRKQIQENFSKEELERYNLSNTINDIKKINMQMIQGALNLTKVLKGNNKLQGSWGEMILKKVLEYSGMREGYEFHTQVNAKQEDGRKLQPDIIVHLPQGKDIIIDSKISLSAYEQYCNDTDEIKREKYLTEHINALRTHIKSLSKKNYQTLLGIKTLDYVLLFIAIEPAFITAINKQPKLIHEALLNNIMLVSPSTLLIALRTINNLWRTEYQNKNVQLIAKKATLLYDKLRLFVEDINLIGQHLDKAQTSYTSAKKRLFEGNGNLISQAENFRLLGIEVKQPIKSEL